MYRLSDIEKFTEEEWVEKSKGLFSCTDADVILHNIRPFLESVRERNAEHRYKMWGSYVYRVDGQLVLGKAKLGDYSGVAIQPDEQLRKDGILKTNKKKDLDESVEYKKKVFTFIHSNPIANFEKPKNRKIRQYFSGTDIGSEFAKAIKDDIETRLMLTYVNVKNCKTYVKLITFPGKKSMTYMKKSNPKLTPKQIKSIDIYGRNIELVNWYAYQDSLPDDKYYITIEV